MAKAKAPEENPLDVYLQIAREGDADATSPNAQFRAATLTQGGHSVELYAKSREEIEARAREILGARGVTLQRTMEWQVFGRLPPSLPGSGAHFPAVNPWSLLRSSDVGLPR